LRGICGDFREIRDSRRSLLGGPVCTKLPVAGWYLSDGVMSDPPVCARWESRHATPRLSEVEPGGVQSPSAQPLLWISVVSLFFGLFHASGGIFGLDHLRGRPLLSYFDARTSIILQMGHRVFGEAGRFASHQMRSDFVLACRRVPSMCARKADTGARASSERDIWTEVRGGTGRAHGCWEGSSVRGSLPEHAWSIGD
jgi:hypothetical protein